jgi:hypothetical protein
MRHTGRNVQKLTRFHRQMFGQILAIPHVRSTAQDINSRLMIFVQMGFGPPTRGDGQQVHTDPLGSRIFRRNPAKVR